MNNPAAQDKAHEEWFAYLWNTELKNYGTHQFVGKVIDGQTITASGILCGAHLVGANTVHKYLAGGGGNHITDWHGTPVSEYFKLFNNYQTPFDPGGTPTASPVATTPKTPVAPVAEDVTPTKEEDVTPTKEAATPTKEAVTPTKEAVTPTKEAVTPTKETVTPTKNENTEQKAAEPKPANPTTEPAPVVTEAPASETDGSPGRQSKFEKWSKFDKWDSGRLKAFLEGRDFDKKKTKAEQEKAAAPAFAQVEESETTLDSVFTSPAEMAITGIDAETLPHLGAKPVSETASKYVPEPVSEAAPTLPHLPFKTTIFEALDNWTDGFVFAPGKFATDFRPPSTSDLGLDLSSIKSFAYQEFTTTDTGAFSVNLFGLYMHFDKGEGMSFM